MTITDICMILATFIGPITAMLAQKWIEKRKEALNRKIWVFHTLMSTRALRASSPEHVQALNAIDVVFNMTKKAEKPVIDAWGEYLDHLAHYPDNSGEKEIQTWHSKGENFLIELLKIISDHLGYSFTSVQLQRGIYHPHGHADALSSQMELQNMILGRVDGFDQDKHTGQ